MSGYKLLFIGFGNVGQAFARFLLNAEQLAHFGFPDVKVVGIITKSSGCLVNEDGLDLKRALKEKSTAGKFFDTNPDWTEMASNEIISSISSDILIEMSSLNIISGQPAIKHIQWAFEHKMHVISINKGPIAFAYRELMDLAHLNDRRLLFEGTVMDGTPVFNMVRDHLEGCKITGFRGILNSTSNFILGEMEQGFTLENAVRKAQDIGFAETDPSFDILGWDSAFKTAILLNVLMDARCTPQDIERNGIELIEMSEIKVALNANKRLKLVCEGYINDGEAKGSVQPVAISHDDMLSNINGTSSILTLQTDWMGDVTIVEHHPELKQTLYAVLSDLKWIFRERFTVKSN